MKPTFMEKNPEQTFPNDPLSRPVEHPRERKDKDPIETPQREKRDGQQY